MPGLLILHYLLPCFSKLFQQCSPTGGVCVDIPSIRFWNAFFVFFGRILWVDDKPSVQKKKKSVMKEHDKVVTVLYLLLLILLISQGGDVVCQGD